MLLLCIGGSDIYNCISLHIQDGEALEGWWMGDLGRKSGYDQGIG